MKIQENIPLGPKTTMRIGGTAAYYTELYSKKDCEEAFEYAKDNNLKLVVIGGGSNTIFANGVIDALIVRLKGNEVKIDEEKVYVQAGKNLPMLINELAKEGMDLSALTGIPGSMGGAVIGNAGQGPEGIWIDSYIESVTIFTDGLFKIISKDECNFKYRESIFKNIDLPVIIWEATLVIPSNNPEEIKNKIESLLKKRIETQPHTKTAGSCFKAKDDVPAWKLIDEAGLRGRKEGGICISEKHANFLINEKDGTYKDAVSLVESVQSYMKNPLEVEMRFVKNDGCIEFP
ncbi:MAG: UDP-N-acetylmuramate dehydrogenase [Candidatus Peribacteraceae bacterium]|nr:UDP-N-acetylmuramate dehydrogenase [Candidatus Peribacteraceae bacterium]